MAFGLKPARRKMRFVPLIAATYFMVSGGPYGIEDILGGAGFAVGDRHSSAVAGCLVACPRHS
jgi:hypothetical protein